MKQIITTEFKEDQDYLLISDLHFDNPKCDRVLLKSHLDHARAIKAKVLINGDFFCIMQGLTDKRHKKSDLRPEHLGDNYFDLVRDEALKWWKPYADMIIMIGYGNHEMSVMRKGEIDILSQFVTLLNYQNNTDVQVGAYSGWVLFRYTRGTPGVSQVSYIFKCKYHHGYGGGGKVTKGTIQNQRMMAEINGADLIWMGHVHEQYHHKDMVESISVHGKKPVVKASVVHHIRTSTYKDESAVNTTHGWHIERGGGVKPLGGYWMRLSPKRDCRDGKDNLHINASFTMTD